MGLVLNFVTLSSFVVLILKAILLDPAQVHIQRIIVRFPNKGLFCGFSVHICLHLQISQLLFIPGACEIERVDEWCYCARQKSPEAWTGVFIVFKLN